MVVEHSVVRRRDKGVKLCVTILRRTYFMHPSQLDICRWFMMGSADGVIAGLS
jgi:hypothetical protein